MSFSRDESYLPTGSDTNSSPSGDHSEFQRVLLALKSNNNKKLGVNKSFRLDEDIITKMAQQAENNNTSLNTEINNALRSYIEWDMFARKIGMIPIKKTVLAEIFQRMLTKEEVVDLANRVAKNAVPEMVYFMKGDLTLESFLPWLKIRMEHCSEVNYVVEKNSNSVPQISLIFKHDLGENWSIYHKIITEYIFKEILKINSVEIQASATTFVLCFKQIP
jgi:hypothetical protein